MELKDGLAEFLLDCEVKNYSPKTIKGYRNCIELLVTFLDQICNVNMVESVTKNHIKRFLLSMQKAKRKPSYINGLNKAFRSWFKYLQQEGYVTDNPMAHTIWSREEKNVIQTFNVNEMRKMVKIYSESSYLECRNKAIICLLFDTGIRCSELCDLTFKNLYQNDICIKGKGNKERFVAKSPYMAKILTRYIRMREEYFKYRNTPDNIFLSRTGRPLTVVAVERVVRIAGKEAKVRPNIRCSPHTCRHFFAQQQLKNGNDVYSVSRLMGHENIRITQRYLQGLNDEDIVRDSVKTSPLMNL